MTGIYRVGAVIFETDSLPRLAKGADQFLSLNPMIFLELLGLGRKKALVILSLLMLFSCPASWAAFGFKLDGSLDKEAISHSYFEGDFARVLPPLEMYRQSFPETATREDSIFVFKYLSVIYAADSSTRGKAESFMVQLLKLMPTIELIDLYISDNIQAIFKDVKKSYLEQQKYVRQHDPFGRPIPDGNSPNPEGKPKEGSAKPSKKWMWWTLGGVGTAVIVTTSYFTWNALNGSDDDYVDIKP